MRPAQCTSATASATKHLLSFYTACCRYQKLKFRHNLYKLREERNIKPSTFGELVSSMLYEKR